MAARTYSDSLQNVSDVALRSLERASHFPRNALDGAVADAAFAGNLQHAFASAQLSLDALFERGIDSPRPTELLALRDRALEASVDALAVHAALKLGESTADLMYLDQQAIDTITPQASIDFRGRFAPASLLPFCYPTAQYEAGQGSIKALAGTRKGQLIQTYRHEIVGDVIAIAAFRVRCIQPLCHLSRGKSSSGPGRI
jgi:hypothetical protein